MRRAISRRTRRVKALDDRWQAMQKVIAERAADASHQHAPGGSTGLLTRTLKIIGSGDAAQLVEEFELDAALLKELREHEKQAAQEVGQWTEKQEVTGKDGGPLLLDLDNLTGLPDDELVRRYQAKVRTFGAGGT